MAPVRALLAIVVVTLGFSVAQAANHLPKPARTEHILYRGGGTGTTTTRFKNKGAMWVTHDQMPGKSEVLVHLQVPTGPNRMITAKFRAEGPAGTRARLPRDAQRKVDALVRRLGEVQP